MVEIQIIIVNEFGEFFGKKNLITSEQYSQVVEISRSFWNNDAFELSCEDGSFVVFPPDIVQKSILKLNKKIIEDVEG